MTTNFLSTGGDGHYVLEESGRDVVTEDLTDLSIVVWYLRRKSPVFPGVFDRILFAEDGKSAQNAVRSFQVFVLAPFVVLYAVR